MFQLDKIIHLSHVLKSKASQIKQTEWDTYFYLTCRSPQKAPKFQNTFIERFIAKSYEKLKTQYVPKTKDCKIEVMTLTTPLYPTLTEYSVY